MTYGMRLTNGNSVVNVDENLAAFVYLGKYRNDYQGATPYIDVTCVGFPMVFIQVPYNRSIGDAGSNRSGVNVRQIDSIGSNQWRVWFGGNNADPNSSMPTYIRVFGQLQLNIPNGVVGNNYGLRVWGPSGNLVFDSNARMLRLAGNTYDVEMPLSPSTPSWDYQDPNAGNNYQRGETSITMPFSMSGKSICANTRDVGFGMHFASQYTDVENQNVIEYYLDAFETAFWATGSTLVARRVDYPTSFGTVLLSGSPNPPSTPPGNITYTRVAVLNNADFP